MTRVQRYDTSLVKFHAGQQMQVKDQNITPQLDQPSISQGGSQEEPEVEPLGDQNKQLISVVLSKAIEFGLRSQLQKVETLDVSLSGRNLAFFKGQIPHVKLFACKAVYQGLHFTQMHIEGLGIRINLGQVLKGKPLRLLEPIPVTCRLILDDQDLNASLSSPLLISGLNDVLLPGLRASQFQFSSHPLEGLQVHTLKILKNSLHLNGKFLTSQESIPFSLETCLELLNLHTFCLTHSKLKVSDFKQPICLEQLTWDLGSEVQIQMLKLEAGQLNLQGQIQINP